MPRFNGYIRNVLYGNCSCMRQRAGLPRAGDGYTLLTSSDDWCDSPTIRHNCTRHCLCISTDQRPDCHCSTDTRCSQGTRYLPIAVISRYDAQH